jgi:hypothetical protein
MQEPPLHDWPLGQLTWQTLLRQDWPVGHGAALLHATPVLGQVAPEGAHIAPEATPTPSYGPPVVPVAIPPGAAGAFGALWHSWQSVG